VQQCAEFAAVDFPAKLKDEIKVQVHFDRYDKAIKQLLVWHSN
jgi:hypothetical protein